MNLFLGTDICEVERIKNLYEKYGEKFLNKVFTPDEISYCFSQKKQNLTSLAARYAAKESLAKALGTGINGLGWSQGINFLDVEVIKETNGSIAIKLHNAAQIIADDKNIKKWAVSISHEKNYVVSTIIGYD